MKQRSVIPKSLKNLLNAESSEKNKRGREVYFKEKCWQDGNSAHILINVSHVLPVIEHN
jgi:hypothetical protein